MPSILRAWLLQSLSINLHLYDDSIGIFYYQYGANQVLGIHITNS